MNINKCDQCGKDFMAPEYRFKNKKHRFCSQRCCGDFNKAPNNVRCAICGKEFHIKEKRLSRLKNRLHITCGRACSNILRKTTYLGTSNHQYSLRGPLNSSFKKDILIVRTHKREYWTKYCPEHPFVPSTNRMLLHRLLVEDNYELFRPEAFVIINDRHYLLPTYDVHHIDRDTLNNDLDNLAVLTRAEHSREHYAERLAIRRNRRNIGVIKLGELLESLEAGNQQPSVENDIKVSTKVQRLGGEESTNNLPTSAQQPTKVDDIVRATDITLSKTVELEDKEPLG